LKNRSYDPYFTFVFARSNCFGGILSNSTSWTHYRPFHDAAHTGNFGSGGGPSRQIQSEIYYPVTTAGTDVSVAAGTHPVVVFGHGFVMAWNAYQNVWEESRHQRLQRCFSKN
jgi:hypothetical protein